MTNGLLRISSLAASAKCSSNFGSARNRTSGSLFLAANVCIRSTNAANWAVVSSVRVRCGRFNSSNRSAALSNTTVSAGVFMQS